MSEIKNLRRSNFVNSFAAIEDINSHGLDTSSILSIGIGESLTENILRSYGIRVTTFDIDGSKDPDIVGSILDLRLFTEKEFSLVIVSHVMEHVPFLKFTAIMNEIARISRFCLLYLPTHGKLPSLSFDADVRDICLDTYFWFKLSYKYSNLRPLLCAEQHYWEVGSSPHRVDQILIQLNKSHKILAHYLNRHWKRSYNFVLESL